MILTIIFCVVSFLAIAGALVTEWGHRRVAGIGYREYKALSWPAQQTMEAWHKVPASNRPSVDIKSVLAALDKKHGGREKVNKHYEDRDYGSDLTSHSWTSGRSGRVIYSDYVVLHDGFTDITAALGEQEYTFAMAGIASHLDTAKNIRKVIEDEALMIREITAKVKEDMSSVESY